MTAADLSFWTVAAAASLALGASVAVDPVAGLIAGLVPPLLFAVVRSGTSRFAVVLVGGLLVFQSQSLGPLKFVYLTAVGVCVALSGFRLARSSDQVVRAFRPLVLASAALVMLICASGIVAHEHGIATGDWMRDVLPYLLLAVLPVVGLDAAADSSPRAMELVVAALGLVAAAGMAVDWLHRRQVSSLGVDRVVLSTTALVALGLSLAITRGGLGPGRLRWLALAVAIVTLMLVTGSRTNLVVLFAVVGLIGARHKMRISLLRAGTTVVVGLLAVAVALPLVASRVVSDPQFLSSRIDAALLVLSGQASADQSFEIRHNAYLMATGQYQLHPWFGTGPGFTYPDGGFTLDTPLLTLAKWGIVGTLVIAGYLLTLTTCFVRVRRIGGYSVIGTAARGWWFALVALIPFGSWLEDKGFALAVTVIVAAVASSARASMTARVRTSPGGGGTAESPTPVPEGPAALVGSAPGLRLLELP